MTEVFKYQGHGNQIREAVENSESQCSQPSGIQGAGEKDWRILPVSERARKCVSQFSQLR